MKPWRNVLVHGGGTPNTRGALHESRCLAETFGGQVVAYDSELGAGASLLACAAQSGADLIVKATSAADVREMTEAGAAALHLLRASRVPVWLYAPPAHRSGRVVAAVNLAAATPQRQTLDELVLAAAARLSHLDDAEVHVVCVADRARDRLYESILPPSQYRHYLENDRAELRRAVTEAATRLGPRSVPHLVEGNAVEELAQIVRELGADAVTLARDEAGARSGPGGVCSAERLFCRIDRSLLLVTPEASVRSNGARSFRASTRATLALPAENAT